MHCLSTRFWETWWRSPMYKEYGLVLLTDPSVSNKNRGEVLDE